MSALRSRPRRAARRGVLLAAALLGAALAGPAAAAPAGAAPPAAARPTPAPGPGSVRPVAAPATPAPTANAPATAPAADVPPGPATSAPADVPPAPATSAPADGTVVSGPSTAGRPAPVSTAAPAPVPAADPAQARQAAAVAAEERWLAQLRAQVSTLAGAATAPYTTVVAGRDVLVLVPRAAPYTLADLRRSAPPVLAAADTRAYLLSASLLVPAGATLDVADPGGLTLRLASGPDGYTGLYVLGGRLTVTGAPGAPVTVTSWDRRAAAPDGATADGRAHLRVVGGTAQFTYAAFLRLGFGAGPTGGVSVTGAPPTRGAAPYTALVRSAKFAGNAVGLHLADTAGVVVAHTALAGNLTDGLVFAGAVRDARVTQAVARGNRGSGFVSAAAARGVALVMCRAEDNRQDGFVVGADPAAAAATAVVAGTDGTAITGGVARNNAHHGMVVDGAADLTLRSNWVVGGDMGIVLRRAAHVTVANNQVRETRRHGVAVLAGTGASVVDNVIADVGNGVYVRDAVAVVQGNTVTKAHRHGISFVGSAAGSTASENLLATTGPSALDTAQADGGVDVGENRTLQRRPGPSGWAAAARYATPTTILWTLLLLLAAGTGLAGRRRPRVAGRAPYGPGPTPHPAPEPDRRAGP
ncbi:hypothetical protein GCM10010124_07980 [Pilimelia terevasa]|uniref:Periplasmic copper-binding protein NosD beta helix domain-containing protein n=1 Tax=Pilimelia terevasa TaxID=53372 RepID=A0A8J3FEY0_9ACTN|nr:right-handed parallel beta-helix repeat-containing protein [Pilimelia terevasa]GGK17814.1 hypothetical protein GCM10010124_07980 [Pilimelia terevasa]